jgi:hypothetical protein
LKTAGEFAFEEIRRRLDGQRDVLDGMRSRAGSQEDRRLGDAQAGDVTTESLQRVLAAVPGKAYRRDIARTLRMVHRFGVENRLVTKNPALAVKAPMQRRSERMLPFESWAEVEAVAEECGGWGPLVIFMADTGARPAEALRLEHRHVHPPTVELPGSKTEGSWRTVHMTRRGIEAARTPPRGLWIRRVFNVAGRPVSWPYFGGRCGIRRSSSPASRSGRRTRSATPSRTGRCVQVCRSRPSPARWATNQPSRRSASTVGGAPRWAKTPPRSANPGLAAQIRHKTCRNLSCRVRVECPPRALGRGATGGDTPYGQATNGPGPCVPRSRPRLQALPVGLSGAQPRGAGRHAGRRHGRTGRPVRRMAVAV